MGRYFPVTVYSLLNSGHCGLITFNRTYEMAVPRYNDHFHPYNVSVIQFEDNGTVYTVIIELF
jgi:hypothetical protein